MGETFARGGEEGAIRSLFGSNLLMAVVKSAIGVGAFSVIAGSILAETTTERGTGLPKLAFVTKADRAAMSKAAEAVGNGDIITGSLATTRLDPCNAPPRKR